MTIKHRQHTEEPNRPTHWMRVASEYFPDAGITQPGDLYHHIAQEIAQIIVNVNVELAPDREHPLRSMEVYVSLDDAICSGLPDRSAVDAIAYHLGYSAQMEDAQTGRHVRLDDMLHTLNDMLPPAPMNDEPAQSVPQD